MTIQCHLSSLYVRHQQMSLNLSKSKSYRMMFIYSKRSSFFFCLSRCLDLHQQCCHENSRDELKTFPSFSVSQNVTTYSAKEHSLEDPTTSGSNFSALPFPLGMMSPYPPASLLYKIFISPEPSTEYIVLIST